MKKRERIDSFEIKLRAVSHKMDAFYRTNLSFVIFLVFTFLATILQIVLFVTGNLSFAGIVHGSGVNNEWVFWTLTAISLLSSSCGIISNIFTQRLSRNFIYFSVSGMALGLISIIFIKSYFIAVTQVMVLALLIHRYILWGKPQKVHVEGAKPHNWLPLVMLVWFTYLIVLIVVVMFWGQEIYDPGYTGIKPMWTWYLDAIGSSFMLLAILLINLKNKYGFLVQALSLFIGVIVLAQAGQIVTLISLLITMSIVLTIFLSWISKELVKHIVEE